MYIFYFLFLPFPFLHHRFSFLLIIHTICCTFWILLTFSVSHTNETVWCSHVYILFVSLMSVVLSCVHLSIEVPSLSSIWLSCRSVYLYQRFLSLCHLEWSGSFYFWFYLCTVLCLVIHVCWTFPVSCSKPNLIMVCDLFKLADEFDLHVFYWEFLHLSSSIYWSIVLLCLY